MNVNLSINTLGINTLGTKKRSVDEYSAGKPCYRIGFRRSRQIQHMISYAVLGCAYIVSCSVHSLGATPSSVPTLGKQAPTFTLVDVGGKSRPLECFKGHPVALFFFCGCPWCVRCAHAWAKFQRGGVVPTTLRSQSVRGTTGFLHQSTVVVFSGEAASARSFAVQTGLDPAQTVLLPDPTMRITLELYRAEPCPRVFVVDAHERLNYTNNHSDDAARQAPEIVIVSRTLAALRAAFSSHDAPMPSDLLNKNH